MILIKVLLLDNWGEKAREVLSGLLFEEQCSIPHVEGIIVHLGRHWDKADVDHYPNLKFIASCTTGLDHIDTEYCKAKGIKIISLQGETDFLQDVWATAEHTWALIMSLIRKIPFAHSDVCAGNWNREAWQGSELRGKTLGIVGYGRVGQQVARFAEAFGMEVIYNDPPKCKKYPTLKIYTFYQEVQDILKTSDIITVHVPLNNETRGMFGAEQFAMMKPGAYFVNTSRGGVVDENALYYSLLHKNIAGAALDVLENEPVCASGSLAAYAKINENLIITPHIAGNTAESREKTQLFIANKIKDFIQGGG